jgi:hypothetical protein
MNPAFDNTPLSAAANKLDISGTIAIFVCDKELVPIRSRAGHESDYQTALRVALYSIKTESNQAEAATSS